MIMIILLLLGNIVFNSAGNILMKIGMKRTESVNLASVGGIIHGLIMNPVLVFGALSYVASLAFYIFVLKKLELSIAYPISVSCTIIIVTIVSGLLLKEMISVAQIVGLVIIMFGIFILTR